MSKINFAIVICTQALQELISSVLRKNDILYQYPITEDDKYLLTYVKQNANDLGNYDSVIIDISALKDTDDQIIEAIEMIRFLDDRIRIIVLEGGRTGSFSLFNQCFKCGIYDMIRACSYLEVRTQLEKCLLQGMTYKDALVFKDAEAFKKASMKQSEMIEGNRTVVFTGTKQRIGVTHCTLLAAYTLRAYGYIVAVVDCTGSSDYLRLMQSYELQMTEDACFTLHDIDFYIKPTLSNWIEEKSYNYILYDIGHYGRFVGLGSAEKDKFLSADKRVLLCGSKAWEMDDLSDALRDILSQDIQMHYLFNFTNTEMQRELWKMMKDVGISENQLDIMEYRPDPLSDSAKMKEILGIQKKKVKKGLFKRGIN